MSFEPLDGLLERLAEGELKAAEEIFVAYEPYLRMVVRRGLPDRLRPKFDSIDVVQSVWVHVLHGLHTDRWRFPDRGSLLALLITITRRRLANRCRAHHVAVQREQAAFVDLDDLPLRHQPRPSEVAQAEDVWRIMLALCPAAHHEVLRLKRQGLRLQEIALRTGLHEGSVRRILRRLARAMAMHHVRAAGAPGV